jgi:capsular exopolysaccharide synthesis family protein
MSQYFKNDSINLSFLIRRILTHWYYFLVIAPIVLSLAFIHLRGANVIYAFNGSLLIGSNRTGGKTPDELLEMMAGSSADNRKVTSENETIILSSWAMVRKTISKLDFGVSYFFEKNLKKVELYHNTPFEVKVDSTAKQIIGVQMFIDVISETEYRLYFEKETPAELYIPAQDRSIGIWTGQFDKKLKFGQPFKSPELNLTIHRNPAVGMDSKAKYYFFLNSLSSLADAYTKSLKVKVLVKDSDVLEVKTEGTTHGKELVFIDSLMDTFVKDELYDKNLKDLKTLNFVTQQFEEATRELLTSQQRLEAFKAGKGIILFENQSGSTINNVEKFEKDKEDLLLKIDYYRDISNVVNDDKQLANARMPSLANVDDNNLGNLLRDFNEMYQDKLKLEVYAKEKNILIQEARIKMEASRALIKEYLANTLQSLTNRSLKDVNRRIEKFSGKASDLPQSQRTLVELEQKVEFNRKRYEFFLQKKEEAEIGLATSTPDSRVVDRAKTVGRVAPNTQFIYFMAILFSGLIPIALIIIKDVVNDKIRNKEELVEFSKIPFIGTIAKGDKKSKIILIEKPNSLIAETFRTLRTSLDYLNEKDGKVIALTSAIAFEGKSFCTVNISTAFALAGKKTLLVCADLRKSTIKNYFKLEEEGLTEFLSASNSFPLDNFIQHTEISNLDIIVAGKPKPNPSELLCSERMNQFLEEVKGKYDKIMIDTPPITFVADYFNLSHHIDFTLYIVRSNFTKNSSLDEINEMYEKGKVKNIRLVLNDYKFPASYESTYLRGGYATNT